MTDNRPSKDRLYELYWGQQQSTTTVAEVCDVSARTVKRWLADEGIPAPPNGHAVWVFRMVTRDTLYERYWGNHESFTDIADDFGVTRKTVGKRFADENIPTAKNAHHDAYIFAMRPKSYYYQLYWGERLTATEIANKHNVGIDFVREHIRATTIPTRDGISADDSQEIPPQFQWPDEQPVACVSDDPTADLPDNPDGSKYMADTSGEFDKGRLYELYWGYGCSIKHITAMFDVPRKTLRDRFEQYGIPVRSWREHTKWEPHHGVPPKYEWPHDRNVDEETPTAKEGLWRQPATSD